MMTWVDDEDAGGDDEDDDELGAQLLESASSITTIVDDEDTAGDDEDDDELGAQLLESASRRHHGDSAAAAGGSQPGGKQVRMSAPGGDDKPGKPSAGKRAVSRMEAGSSGKKGGRLKFWSLVHRMTGTWGQEARRSFKVSGRRLLPSHGMEVKSMAMFVTFQLLLVLIYALCFYTLNGLQSPISQLNSAQHIVYRASRTRFFAINLVMSTTAADKAKWRSNLARSCSKLHEEYEVMLYGGMLEWLSTSTRSEFLKFSPPVVFEKVATSHLFFGTRDCLRDDPSSCFPPGHEFYEVTHSGINPMMQRYLQECRLLQMDNDTDVHPNSSSCRYKYIYYVGGKDLYEATQALAYGITRDTIAAYDEMKTLNVALLVLTIVLPVGYLLFVFRPMLALVRQHTGKVAGLLSQLPPEVDVESKLKAALDHNRRSTSQQQQQQQDADDDLGD
uniref:Uncharacterized protein n=1 Tax=Tetradesmus obliquus TaxID=3088 RepID=A0A383VIJ6_TETOB|eukprot:jgi/Sobl393_1/10657/SZX74693.1